MSTLRYMLLTNKVLDEIKAGTVTLIFRRWKRAGVNAGGTQMTQRGVIGIDAIDVVTEDDITDLEAKKRGSHRKTNLSRTSTTATRISTASASSSWAKTRENRFAKTQS